MAGLQKSGIRTVDGYSRHGNAMWLIRTQSVAISHQTPYIHGPAIISTLEPALGKQASVTIHMYVVYVGRRHTDTTAVLAVKRYRQLNYIQAAYSLYRIKMRISRASCKLIEVCQIIDRYTVRKKTVPRTRTLGHIKPFNATWIVCT